MNKRIFVSKKQGFQVEGNSILNEIRENLYETGLTKAELYNVYDIFNCDEEDIKLLKTKVLSEPVTDNVYDEIDLEGKTYVAIENLPGQYDQRADSAEQCLALLNSKDSVTIKSGRVIIFYGEVKDLEKIKKYLINPVETREKDLTVLENNEDVTVDPVPVLDGFRKLSRVELENFVSVNGLAMTADDLEHIQKYFIEEDRDPTETEIKVLDTYWSDHCRHTTFETFLKSVTIEKGEMTEAIQKAYEKYLKLRTEVHGNKKPMTLMDMGTLGGKYMRKIGKLDDMEITDEINACSIEVDIDVDGENERWLLMFKNETHNHPTEIEPFGGASTCIGGAIRDPLSGRAYVYQAMRITGAGDICEKLEDTLPNKLPQVRISKGAAHGYSSYGNQIGLATTFVKEIYHNGYKAKRMEVGAVVGAVKKEYVLREEPKPGDLVIVLGGKTGRDGVGGATGSSKEHNDSSLTKCSSEVQKGNAPIERKIQRAFRNPEVTKLIKKSNDFGAGGVSVAIGELARGIEVNLDMVSVKYLGLSGTELAISESQERMAVVISPENQEKFEALMKEENLETRLVAKVTEKENLVIKFRGETIVDIARSFLDTNGVRQEQDVKVVAPVKQEMFKSDKVGTTEEKLVKTLKDMNVASQRGMVEMFDSTVGRSTVLMPYGGKYQLTESEGSVQKFPTFGFTNTASVMTYGFNPYISEKSPYLGAIYAVIESLARLTAVGADYKKARLTFQEYFERLGKESSRWGKPFMALLGALEAQVEFETPAIGGKDSMSGTFKNIDVPPTLISFAVTTEKTQNIISSEFKEEGNYIYLVKPEYNSDFTPKYDTVKSVFDNVRKEILSGKIISASVVKFGGVAEALMKMTFGNKLGINVKTDEELFDLIPGAIVVESKEKLSFGTLLGTVENTKEIKINDAVINIDKALVDWEERYAKIYPYNTGAEDKKVFTPTEKKGNMKQKASVLYDEPKVLVLAFPGTNSEYDTAKAFERAGGKSEIFVINNLTVKDMEASIDELSKKIKEAQIVALPGGFSAGDEPDGSGKFITNILQNPKVKLAIKEFLSKEGLMLGICNGFQALIKSGLLPYGDMDKLNENSPTLFRNDINRHISRIATTRIASNSSPWLSSFEIGDMHSMTLSHGEGKFVVSEEFAKELFENGQVATQYCNLDGEPTMDGEYNLNGSYYAIEGITSKDGQILGKMGHSERYEDGTFKNIYGEKMQDIFQNGVNFFKK
ncbi:phosphoribosylformylglycinamidine synthase [Fusobacterium sp.]|uniref:phosphoribosylformylglycinamidine synthase n=1 Tax=Fusobacterium sp. TaxID=68766 RepID=UPI00262AF581|nr:phosphoribosylformylglycinamidine synthase [Fusobacterium sp.]